MHAQLRDEHSSSYIVLYHQFLELPSLQDFLWGDLSCLQEPSYWSSDEIAMIFSFLGLLCIFCNCVYLDEVVRGQRGKSNRDSAHTLELVVPLVKEKGSLSSEFQAFVQSL